MNDTSASQTRPFFECSAIRFRFWPILLAAIVMQLGLVMTPRAIAIWGVTSWPGLFQADSWTTEMLALAVQTLCGLLGIAILKRRLPTADPCLRWPPGRNYLGVAVMFGLAMGVIMLLADSWPSLLAGVAPDTPFPMARGTDMGWLAAISMAGLAEEIGFRGLLVGMLTALLPGRVRAGRFDIPLAGVVVGVLFGLAHYQSFIYSPLHLAIAQQIYAFAGGLVYVWLMERSRSLLAPMVAHSLSDLLEVGLVMFLRLVWR